MSGVNVGILDDAWRKICFRIHTFSDLYSNKGSQYGSISLDFKRADRYLYGDLPQICISFARAPKQRILVDPVVQGDNAEVRFSYQVIGGPYGLWISRSSDDFCFHGETREVRAIKTFVPKALLACFDEISSWDGVGQRRGRLELPEPHRPSP